MQEIVIRHVVLWRAMSWVGTYRARASSQPPAQPPTQPPALKGRTLLYIYKPSVA
jgi:hypothetical protein